MKHLVKIKCGRTPYSACGIWLFREEETENPFFVECKNCKRTRFYKGLMQPKKQEDK